MTAGALRGWSGSGVGRCGRRERLTPIDLVFTVALSQEIPTAWLRRHGVAVHRLKALTSGALRPGAGPNSGVLFVVTGVGATAAGQAAAWIRDHIAPRFVVNLGTAGSLHANAGVGEWVTPARVENEAGEWLSIDRRLPFPWPRDSKRRLGGTLLSVAEARPGAPRPHWLGSDYVDMESCAQAQVFAPAETSFHVLKRISDRPGTQAQHEFADALSALPEALEAPLGFLAADESARISVIVPVHNRARRIRPTLDSVLEQSLPAAELVVVDDGSDDGTDEVLESYADSITNLRLARNRGVSAARNAGLALASSPWIAFLDSDDVWAPHKLSRQWAYYQCNPHYDALQCEEIWIRDQTRVNPRNRHAKPAGWIWSRSLDLCLVSPSAIMIRKALLQSLGGFDESLPACEDYDLWLRLGRNHVVGLVPHADVTKHGGHEDQLSRRYAAMDRFRVAALRKALHGEKDRVFRDQIAATLKHKLGILIQGARKRGLTEQMRHYETLKSELRDHD